MKLTRVFGLLAALGAGACARESAVSPPKATGPGVGRAASLASISVAMTDSLATGQCAAVPPGVVYGELENYRNVAYAIPTKDAAVRRVLVSFDMSGKVVRVSDIRFRPDHVEVQVDLQRGSGWVVGKTREPGGPTRSRWSTTADAIMSEPSLGYLRSVVARIKAECERRG